MSKEMLELADEIEYCVERGIDAHLTAKSLTIISAALRAYAVAEPVAEMTIDSIEQRYKTWRGALTVFERPSHQDAFREGYVAGWNDRESFHPAPAAALPASEALEKIKKRLADLRDARDIYRKSERYRPDDVQRNDREIRWLVDLNTLLRLPAPEAAPTREEIIEQPLTAEFTKSLPGGALDDSTYSQIEDALDAIDAPMTDNGRYMTLVERILALKSAPHQRQGE